jgi:RNA polymerase sigma-70 factor (ECF subfamily)
MTVPGAYIENLVALQTRLYAYVLTLLADTQAAEDVLQETNLVLFRKAGEFTEGTDFDAWAFRTARNQCLAYWTLRGRDRLVLADHVLFATASPAPVTQPELDRRRDALNECLERLPVQQRELVRARYAPDGSVRQMAKALGRTEAAISQSLHRIRNALGRCIQTRLSEGTI